MRSSKGAVETLLLTVIVGLTLATGYIHFWVGGVMLTLNAMGYATLALATVVSAIFLRRLLPLVLIALAGYAAVTIVGWMIMGPYFDVAYLAKGIEVVLISTIAFTLWRMADETKAVVNWALGLPAVVLGRRSPATDPDVAAAPSTEK